jgi:hypothetical protein
MASRSNSCSELTRFWREAKNGCLITESVPVPVPYAQSDIDLVAVQPALQQLSLPDSRHDRPPIGLSQRKFTTQVQFFNEVDTLFQIPGMEPWRYRSHLDESPS